jgi:hypothetical protein
MGIGEVVPEKKVKKSDWDRHWVEVGGSPVEKVELTRSREVALEPFNRTVGREGYKSHISLDEFRADRHKVISARTGKETGGVSRSGIQIYRHWFQFLKLALELEDLGVTTLVTRQIRPARQLGGGAGGLKYHLRDTVPLKITKEKYDGWDLSQVLSDTFDKWWDSHSYLFEGYPTALLNPRDNLDPDFLYVRIDRTSKLEDLRDFITREVKPKISGKPRFAVDGYPRPDVIQNRYNALVMSMKGIRNVDICDGKNIYLRATDKRSRDMIEGKDGKMEVTGRHKVHRNSKGKRLYSTTVSKQRDGGLFHLQEVMRGRFGDVPTKGIK